MAKKITKQIEESVRMPGWLHRTLRLHGHVVEVEVPPGPGAKAELDRACREAQERAENEHVGAKVRNANRRGRPVTISDEDLAALWRSEKRDRWTAPAAWARKQLKAKGIALSADRITKRVRAYLQRRGEWT